MLCFVKRVIWMWLLTRNLPLAFVGVDRRFFGEFFGFGHWLLAAGGDQVIGILATVGKQIIIILVRHSLNGAMVGNCLIAIPKVAATKPEPFRWEGATEEAASGCLVWRGSVRPSDSTVQQ